MSQVYVIAPGPEGPCKVGMTDYPEARLRALQCGSPVSLGLWAASLSGSRSLEILVHRALDAARGHGEWFHVPVTIAVQALIEAAQRCKDPRVDVLDVPLRYELGRAGRSKFATPTPSGSPVCGDGSAAGWGDPDVAAGRGRGPRHIPHAPARVTL